MHIRLVNAVNLVLALFCLGHHTIGQLQQEDPTRLMRLYGTRTERLLGDVGSMAELGTHFGADLYAREVDYLVSREWARTADDVLWRRTKLGLHFTDAQTARLAAYITDRNTPA